MNYKILDINSPIKSHHQATMTLYLPDNFDEIDINRKRPTVVICPGGGYRYTSVREAEPVALKFLSENCNAVVGNYSCAPARFPTQIVELGCAIKAIRENAEEWNVDTDKIVVMGFSAGGHVAASYSTLWYRAFMKEHFSEIEAIRPNGMILCYPVISSGEKAHRGSFDNLLGDKKDDPEMLELVSAEKQVTEDTPKAFIWHTFTDNTVPVENSLMMASALAEKKISTELHIFPKGFHGLSLSNDAVYKAYDGNTDEIQVWIDMAIRWLKNL